MNLYLEIFGYIGTVLVILSMAMTSLTKLRLFNISGSIISAIYSIIYNAWPIAIMNICLIVINLYHLIKKKISKKDYLFIKTNRNDPICSYFLKQYDNIDSLDNKDIYMLFLRKENIGIILGTELNHKFEIENIYIIRKHNNKTINNIIISHFNNL